MAMPFIWTPLVQKTQKPAGNYFLETKEGSNFLPAGPNSSRQKMLNPLFLRNFSSVIQMRKNLRKIFEKMIWEKHTLASPLHHWRHAVSNL